MISSRGCRSTFVPALLALPWLAVAGPPQNASSPELERALIRWEKASYYSFCGALGSTVRGQKRGVEAEAIRRVAVSRYSVSPRWDKVIADKRLEVGMPMCAVVAAFGEPDEVREIGTRLGKGWSVWYRAPRRILVYLDANQQVVSYGY